MTPIVDRLEGQYGESVAFRRLNARDGGTGQRAFEAARLPGHPVFILLLPDGTEAWRGVGLQEAGVMETALVEALGGA